MDDTTPLRCYYCKVALFAPYYMNSSPAPILHIHDTLEIIKKQAPSVLMDHHFFMRICDACDHQEYSAHLLTSEK